MKKTFTIVMLPTEKADAPIGMDARNTLFNSTINLNPQHLSILSDQQPKEGDWFISELNQVWQHNGKVQPSVKAKKIVATTDFLMLPLKNKIDSTHPRIPQLPESFIQAYIKAYNEGKPITEVDLEIEELSPMEEMLQNEKYVPNNTFTSKIKTRSDNTVIVHQSKMYSKEDMIKHIQTKIDEYAGSAEGDIEYNALFDFRYWIQKHI